MGFDIAMTEEAHCIRIVVEGEATLGQLMSLMHVLEVDSASWPKDAVLFDLRGLATWLSPSERRRLKREAATCLLGCRRIVLRWRARSPGEGSGLAAEAAGRLQAARSVVARH
jgi:hypothetical protein